MRIVHLRADGARELAQLPQAPLDEGFVWIASTRTSFQAQLEAIQASLQALGGQALLDLHVSDLLNAQLPSYYDDTWAYDLLVFRRLGAAGEKGTHPAEKSTRKRSGPPVLRRIDTHPVGFVVMDRVLLTVHPPDCPVRAWFADRLLSAAASDPREDTAGRMPTVRLPSSPAELMLRTVNHMVDGYLALRRELTRQLDHWQTELLHPKARFANWSLLLDARMSLHQLDELCEDQRSAVQDWLDTLDTWPHTDDPIQQRELELLKVRSRDVLEHIERVSHHVRRLEHSTETAVQMHFSVQSNRTNDIMRTLTAITAVFLPLNLIAGVFGMNFEFLPLIHQQHGFWWALGTMGSIALVLLAWFWRKRYLARSGR